ncbi:hypothetical protein P10159_0273 [Citrobacter portucalensis]|nr:hypothetical protein P10159_0273 [Citrobacter portucalensis]
MSCCKHHDHCPDQDVTATFTELSTPMKKPNDNAQGNQDY